MTGPTAITNGIEYSYVENSQTIKMEFYNNNTEIIRNINANVEIFYDISQEIMTIDRNVKIWSLPTGVITKEPLIKTVTMKRGTVTNTTDLDTKIIT